MTDEQYNAVLRYVDGEMGAAEGAAFEAALWQDKTLQAEVAFYTEVRTLSESIEQKNTAGRRDCARRK